MIVPFPVDGSQHIQCQLLTNSSGCIPGGHHSARRMELCIGKPHDVRPRKLVTGRSYLAATMFLDRQIVSEALYS